MRSLLCYPLACAAFPFGGATLNPLVRAISTDSSLLTLPTRPPPTLPQAIIGPLDARKRLATCESFPGASFRRDGAVGAVLFRLLPLRRPRSLRRKREVLRSNRRSLISLTQSFTLSFLLLPQSRLNSCHYENDQHHRSSPNPTPPTPPRVKTSQPPPPSPSPSFSPPSLDSPLSWAPSSSACSPMV